MPESTSSPRSIRVPIGLVRLVSCLHIPVWYLISGPNTWNLRLEPWLSFTWVLPGPLAWVLLCLGGMVSALVFERSVVKRTRILDLEDPGIFYRAVIEARGGGAEAGTIHQ